MTIIYIGVMWWRIFFCWKHIGDIVTHVMGTPTDEKVGTYGMLLATWKTDISKIINWINNSLGYSIGTQVAKDDTTNEVWYHLDRLYTLSNFVNNTNWRLIFEPCNRILWVFQFFMLLCLIYDISRLLKSCWVESFQTLYYDGRATFGASFDNIMFWFWTMLGTILHCIFFPIVG